MIDALFTQPNYLAAKRMIDATVTRHEALASNLANAETPNYKRVDLAPGFSQELQSAVAGGNVQQLQTLRPGLSVDTNAISSNQDGNTVQWESELFQMSQNTLTHAFAAQLLRGQLAKLRTAITGRGS